MADDPIRVLRDPSFTEDDRRWLQTNLALAGACQPPAPPAEQLRHPWTPDGTDTRCLLCDDPEVAMRHWPERKATA